MLTITNVSPFGPMDSALQTKFPAYMDGVFLSYFYLSFTCERAFVLDFLMDQY